jgi:Ni/Co efflux regulator RcnB
LADKPDFAGKGHGHGNDKHDDNDKHAGKAVKKSGHNDDDNDDDNSNDTNVIIVQDDDRAALKHYIADQYHKKCPPGLAKKHNGCLPPGQAKKLYQVGQPLPDTIKWHTLPDSLLSQLNGVPAGYQYVQVDQDVLVISEATKKVIDAVTLLSTVK